VKFAVNLPNFGVYADPRTMVDLAVAAERAGWDGFFVWDHIVVYDGAVVGDPWVILGAIATRTERITIGPMVTPLPRRRPWVVARQAASLDHLSGGRVVLGVGLGFPPDAEFGTFGEAADLRTRAELLDESLAIITGMWTGEPFSFTGTHYGVGPGTFLPRPVQRPRIPIWVAATWPRPGPVRRAARYEGVYPLADEEGTPGLLDAAGVAEVAAEVSRLRGGLTGYDVSALVVISGDEERDRATIAAFRRAGVTWAHVGEAMEGETIAAVTEWIAAGPPR
jgi:alkanesulfonate monooxygenase SsuD/methylene tetrahydromethanopterin reductase-like flavin-dependent oxidoreductase (luciferase family)